MNDGNNDEFSAAKKMREGEKKHKEEVCLLSEHTCIFMHCVCLCVCQSHKGRQGEKKKKVLRIKKGRKWEGTGLKQGHNLTSSV